MTRYSKPRVIGEYDGKTFADLVTADVPTIGVNGSGQNGSGRHARMPLGKLEDRPFIAWDGEGAKKLNGEHLPQEYVLLGCSTGERITGPSLTTLQCLRFIVSVAKANPTAFHVGFAFDYDANMILRNLTPHKLRVLKDKGSVLIDVYRVEHVLGKWLQITEYGYSYRPYGGKLNLKAGKQGDKFTVRIADIFGFFQSSFVKAIQAYLPDHPLMAELDVIEKGKDKRNTFTYEQIEYITSYWEVEIALLLALVESLRDRLYRVGLRVGRWHGPGAIANHVYKSHGIARYKALTPEAVREASRYAYAGGRFELFRVGRFEHVYGIDINSAYPAAISRLPSLSEGEWRHVDHPKSISEFGVYHVRLNGFAGPIKKPSPLFHRDMAHNISYPWLVEGWYWTPEIKLVLPMLGKKRGFELVEGWEYVGWHTRPFEFVRDMYDKRRDLKRAGDGSQVAIKLALNSLYGKMAQRVGWERNGGPPTWHQLEWAGFVTSATRARLFSVMSRIPWEHLIGVETDGIYTTCSPSELGITDSGELGQWETSEYEEMLYVQSGVYYAKDSNKGWIGKYRGLDNGSITETSLADFLRTLGPNPGIDSPEWEPIVGPTTRFIGYRNAIHREDSNQGPMKVHHCRWETTPREIHPGGPGKRTHSHKLCAACRAGANAYDMPHDLVIRSRSIGEPMSTMHSIPWEDKDNGASADWRAYAAQQEDLLA